MRRTWEKFNYFINVCRVNSGIYIENLETRFTSFHVVFEFHFLSVPVSKVHSFIFYYYYTKL